MVGEQVHTSAAVGGGEPIGELGEERREVAARIRPLELRREGAHPREVGLARDLLVGVRGRLGVVAELIGDLHDGIGHARVRAHPLQPLQHRPRSRSTQERPVAHLVRDARGGEGLLERLRPGVDPVEHRDLLERHALLTVKSADGFHHDGDLGGLVGDGTRDRGRARGDVRPEGLPDPAQARHEPIRELEDLRGRAVVLLQAHDRRVREPLGEAQQVLGRCARERVDRLVVVPHHAEVIASAQPALQKPRLQRIHILELVYRERGEARAHGVGRVRVLVEELQGEPEHVLEVQPAHRALAPLVPFVDREHQLRRDRRLMVAEVGEVASRRDHPVLGPLDLTGELAPGKELVRRRQGVRE